MDWSEQKLEDWVVKHPREVWDADGAHVEVAGRQVTLPSGNRLDVVLVVLDAQHQWRIVVVEIKKGMLDLSALCQLLGYIEEVRQLYPPSVRVSGVLLGSGQTEQLYLLTNAIPFVHVALYDLTPQISAPVWYFFEEPEWVAATNHRAVEPHKFTDLVGCAGQEIAARWEAMLPVPVRATPQFVANGRPE